MTKTYTIRTFGCQMNYSDSERVAAQLEQCGFIKTPDPGVSDLLIVNTCSVRQKSEDKAYGFIVNQKKESPKTKIAVTGCMVRQTGDRTNSKDKLLKHDPIDLVFRIEDTVQLPKILKNHFPDFLSVQTPKLGVSTGKENDFHYFQINPKTENTAQVFVPIMQGCDKFCTYCIVPYTRGRESSRNMDEIYTECEKHVKNGAKEITLLGQNVNSYTQNKKKCFADLLLKIDKLHEKGLSRLRFTSPHPRDFTDDVIDAMVEMKTSCNYIHLPAQHGSDRILEAMNRRYKAEDYEALVAKIRKKMPDCTIATDIIVGFPGETAEDFDQLCDFARRIGFSFSYTAIFSPRKNTPAAEMKEDFISGEEKRRRFKVFDDIIKSSSWGLRDKYVGKTLEVLVESSEPTTDGHYKNTSRSREYFEVVFEAGRSFVGQEVDVKIEKRVNYTLVGKLKEGM